MPGLLALVGGDEFHPGNEPHDSRLVAAAGGRPIYVVATAARDNPGAAVATARRWFASLGSDVEELRVRSPVEARSKSTAAQALDAGLIYIAGGDPGWAVEVLRGSRVWAAIAEAWRRGAALAASSAGAMALCQWSLIRARWPDRTRRRPAEGLGLVPGCAFLPHFDTFGERWIPSAQKELGTDTLLVGVDERTAALWDEPGWSATGAGAVTLVTGSERRRFAAPAAVVGLPVPATDPGPASA